MGPDGNKAKQVQEHFNRQGETVGTSVLWGEEPIPTVAEKPVKSLGRWYHATLKDSEQVDQLRQDTMCGLESINKTMLPGRLKLWCLQFGLLPRLMWPLTIYEVPISKVEKLERVVSKFAKKWLALYY